MSKPALASPQVSLGGRVNNVTGGPVTVTIEWSDTGFSPGESPAVTTAAVGTAPLNSGFPGPGGASNIAFAAYVDGTNTLDGTQTPVNTLSFSNVPANSPTQSASNTGPGPSGNPFSMTLVETFTMSGGPSMVSYFFNNFSLMVAPYPPLTLSCPVASGQAGLPYNAFLAASGGNPPYTFSITNGALPVNLMLDSKSGAISGIPLNPGPYPFTAQVVDSSGTTANTVATSCGLTITPPPTPPTLTCPAATGTVSALYNSSLVATGGTPPYKFSIISGMLPNGLFLNPTSGAITGTPSASGMFNFTAQVMDSSGDIESNTVNTGCNIVDNLGPPIAKGDTATIGFWHNKNGQALIQSLNGGSTSTSLANWLASQFPYLYGGNSLNNLTNKTNADVAALFLTFFDENGQKTDAQILGGALAAYVTSTNLAGSAGAGYGFNTSPGGTGTKTYNVGSLGVAIGLMNNTSYTVLQLLMQANLDIQNGTFNANAFNSIFSDINQTGDIS
jgi:hypothetical protein